MQVCNEIERENYSPAENDAEDVLGEEVNYPEMLSCDRYIFMTFTFFNVINFANCPDIYAARKSTTVQREKCLCVFVVTSKNNL